MNSRPTVKIQLDVPSSNDIFRYSFSGIIEDADALIPVLNSRYTRPRVNLSIEVSSPIDFKIVKRPGKRTRNES